MEGIGVIPKKGIRAEKSHKVSEGKGNDRPQHPPTEGRKVVVGGRGQGFFGLGGGLKMVWVNLSWGE